MSDMGDRKGSGDWGNRNEAGWEKTDDEHWPGQSDENVKPQFEDDNECQRCGANDHFSRNCPNVGFDAGDQGGGDYGGHSQGRCYNCKEEGHNKAECPHPKVFTGTCNSCGDEGHPAALCPSRGPIVCKNCKEEGHAVQHCTKNRVFDMTDVEDKSPEDAWTMMKLASHEMEIQDFRDAIRIYSKACPDATYQDIAKRMLEESFGVFLIGLENPEQPDHLTLIDLQGQSDRDFLVGFFGSQRFPRKSLKDRWPGSVDENMERLANAGLPFDRLIAKCRNCDKLGHISKSCPEEAREVERVQIICVNCKEVGHRVRDCTQPRKSKHGCRNCGNEGHQARECPEPRSASDVECHKCNNTGHFAKDCPEGGGSRTCRNCGSEDHIARECDQPRNPDTIQCRNCDEMGHPARECTKPKDWSKVQCNRCHQLGHTVRRCPLPEESGENEYGGSGFGGFGESSGYAQNTQNDSNNWNDAGDVTEQFSQLNTEDANQAESSW